MRNSHSLKGLLLLATVFCFDLFCFVLVTYAQIIFKNPNKRSTIGNRKN